VLYTIYLIFASTRHDLLNEYSAVLVWFVFPLTALTVVITLVQDLRQRRNTVRAD
jgi:cation:H+ antiporter